MIQIRQAEAKDLPFLARAEAALFSDGWSEELLSDCMSRPLYGVLIACREEVPAGYLITMTVLGEGEVLRIGCLPAFQKQGVASALLEYWLRTSRDRGMTAALLEVRSRNGAALSLYRKFGFLEEGRRKDYYRNPPDDAVLMGKRPL